MSRYLPCLQMSCCRVCRIETPKPVLGMCPECNPNSSRNHYRQNREKILAARKANYAGDREKYKAKTRAYALANPGLIQNWKAKRWAKKCFHAACASSKRRGHAPPTIDEAFIEALYESQKCLCYWTGVLMEPSPIQHAPLQPSLERLDNAVGYIPGNVVLACYCINRARRDIPAKDFEIALRAISKATAIKYAD